MSIMMRLKLRNVIICGSVAAIAMVSNINVSNADSSLEQEFSGFIEKYDSKNLIVENGISLKKGETLDLSITGWEMSNDNIVELDENNILKPINKGTVFLSNEIDGKTHVIEIYVSDKNAGIAQISNNQITDRNYYKVFIDAGHGGSDPGNVSYGYSEDELNLQISKLVEKKLNAKNINIEVKMSRTTDKFIALDERAEMANNYGADAFVSIHNNAATPTTANGIETFHHTNKTSYKPLASGIQNNAIKHTGAKDRGVKTANYAVLRETNMPSALFEGGFMTNKVELEKLANPAYQDKLATAIANGIETYLVNNIELKPEISPPQVSSTKTLTKDIYKYDAGSGKYLTYINGKGYSQYSYVNKAESYAFIPSSWMKAVGLEVDMPTKYNGYLMQITNPYVEKSKEAENILKQAKSGEISKEQVKSKINKMEDLSDISNKDENTKSSLGKTLTKDIYKYDAGSGKYLTYINGKGYSQYSYLNGKGSYAFVPNSWIKAAGVEISTPSSSNGYITKINNIPMSKYKNTIKELKQFI